ncbi:hypothetical protein HYS93_04320 [Candidatus Daviesbacteria bacterium]|nr:hypothetical protein [Candidatus Daviesbacteria bacterium]
MRFKLITLLLLIQLAVFNPNPVFAQRQDLGIDSPTASATASATASSILKDQDEKNHRTDITRPEELEEKEGVLALFSKREAKEIGFTNFLAYAVQYSFRAGVPANTIILILLLPFLATIVAFIRHIVGLPSLEMLVPVALSITLVATGITAGFILLIIILIASIISRFILKRLRIMQLPKMSLSLFVVSFFVFITLTISASAGILIVKQLSIFPVLIFILLSDKIVSLQLQRSLRETTWITLVTVWLGILGFLLLSSDYLRNFVLLYPEIVLILIPINILIGRYFGLRLTEYLRFSSLQSHANK